MAADDFRLPGLERPQRIGAGGFGTVYRAWQPEFGRWVAVKVLAGTLTDADEQRRFERERMASGSLSGHPAIATVHAHGVTEDGRPYITMELLEGGSLADRLGDGPLEAAEVTSVGVTLAGALAAAHEAGVLHRDVKPENVLFSAYGQPALADFGIARLPGVTATRSGVITASLSHAPPEVLGGEPPDERADVYGLASTLWTGAVGHPPFSRGVDEPIAALVARIATAAPPDAAEHGVPAPLADLLTRALAKDPTERPTSAAAFGEELQAVQSTLGVPVTPLVMGATAGSLDAAGSTGAVDADQATRPRGPAPAPSARRRRTLVAVAVTVLLAGTAGAWGLTRPEGRVDPELIAAPSPSPSAKSDGSTTTDDRVGRVWPSTSPSSSGTSAFDESSSQSSGMSPNVGVGGRGGGSTGGGSTGGGSTGGGSTGGDQTDDRSTSQTQDDPTPTASPTSSPRSSTSTGDPTNSPSPLPSSSPTQTNRSPVAVYATRVTTGTASVTFDASSSSDPDGDNLSYRWSFNDGTADKTGKVVTHTFTAKNDNDSPVWTVTLTVKDPGGATDSAASPRSVRMPDLYSVNSVTAFQATRGAGLRPLYSPVWNETTTFTEWDVWSQWPASGTTLNGDDNVRIAVFEESTCSGNPDETRPEQWCYEDPPPSPTLDKPYF